MESEIHAQEGSMWIESHQELENHPKTKKLMRLMGWNKFEAIGRLHVFWWWCLKYALNGDLSKFEPGDIADAFGVELDQAEKLQESLVSAGFVDSNPHNNLMVHGWWGFVKFFLRGKFAKTPEKWKAIQDRYHDDHTETLWQPQGYLTPPNQTKPNQTIPNLKEKNMLDTNADGVSIALVFPCKGMGRKEWALTKAKLAEYQEAFPAMDVLAEARHALQWTRDNPTKRKTERGMPAFLTRWFGRNQNQGGSGYGAQRKVGRVEAEPGKYDHLKTRIQALPKMPEPTTK